MAGETQGTPMFTWPLAKEKDQIIPERLLLDAVERMGEQREGRVAVHVHLSSLQQHHRRENYLRLASDTFETHVKSYAGHLFDLGNGDLFFIGKNVRTDTLAEAVDRLRMLFAEDPLTQYSTREEERGGFATYYDFKNNYDQLHQDAMTLLRSAERDKKQKGAGARHAAPHGRPFLPGDLARLITVIERADLTNITHRQTACSIGASGIPLPLFQETYISFDDLQSICTPDIDLLSDRWLFHYLTRTLDKRMLIQLVTAGFDAHLPFSLNLNIDTLLSPEFRRFDEIVPEELRGRAVIELHKVDVFSDIGAFFFARDYVRRRGYRLCLDGLTHHTLPLFEEGKLDIDLYKVYWAPEGLKTASAEAQKKVSAIVDKFGAERVILCRCDAEEAINTGRDLGICQFQGRMIDRLLTLSRAGSLPLPSR